MSGGPMTYRTLILPLFVACSDGTSTRTGGTGDTSSSLDTPSWAAVALDGQCVVQLAIDPSAPDDLLAGSSSGFFRSTDGGRTWSPVTGLPSGGATALGVHPTESWWVAVTGANSVWRSADAGA